MRMHFKHTHTKYIKSKWMGKIYYANSRRKWWEGTQYQYQIRLRNKIKPYTKGTLYNDKSSIHRKERKIMNTGILNNRASKYMKQKRTELKAAIDDFIIMEILTLFPQHLIEELGKIQKTHKWSEQHYQPPEPK